MTNKSKVASVRVQYQILIEATININRIIQSIFILTLSVVNYDLSNPTVEIH